MGTAIWFSRHPATPEQVAEIEKMGYTLECDPKWAALAARNLTSIKDVQEAIHHLREFAAGATEVCGAGSRAIFGVFSAPIQAHCLAEEGYYASEKAGATPCYSAWNITRTPEDGKPTFQHLRFCRTGQI